MGMGLGLWDDFRLELPEMEGGEDRLREAAEFRWGFSPFHQS